MIASLLIIRWVLPEEVGIWQTVTLISAYILFLQFGIQSGLNLELPVLLGKKENDRAFYLLSTARGYAIILASLILLATIVFFIAGLLFDLDLRIILGVSTVGVMNATSTYYNHLIVTFRSSQSFIKLAKIYFFQTIIIILAIPLIYIYKFYGILIFNVLINISLVLLMHFVRPYKVKSKLKFSGLKDLFKRGIAMILNAQLNNMAQSFSKIFILKFGNVYNLGLFSPAIALQGVFALIPSALGQFIHPQLGYKYGQTGYVKELWPLVKKLILLFSFISLLISILVWVIAPYLLDILFPNYQDSLWAIRIMAISFVFSASATFQTLLHTIKAYKYVFIYPVANFLGSILFPLCTVYLIDNVLTAVATGLVINAIILFIVNFVTLRVVLFKKEFN